MELKIIDENVPDLYLAFGITEERAVELCSKMNQLMEDRPDEIRWCNILSDIAKFCNTNEELVACVTSNYRWLIRKGFIKI